ncbi:serine/threonine protein kinase [Myxococcus sp. RHSTA-1-4]|uniref:serine/threonine protein kinase n=1 Tax=Myxococcus sp. RHSTA-1-4 TaxID=2874601 RepID=UPI001CBB7E17|nr:serine/threonine protein kinase [Myxococcus sp. RHSTA-1-4]MBZ4420955.1 serine/threonine protein kinase [Myxococcus sp. RHSTA-1-4]
MAATHSAGGVHRDFKGDNVLVREADGWPFLTDFGSGHFLGAAPLTEPPFPPGTPAYRSPEAWRSARRPVPEPVLPYAPTAADDVFALGVTAWRLLTDEYPSPPDSAFRPSPLDEAAPPSPRTLNPRCIEVLSGLTTRMLSANPEARGSARELAKALEQAAREAGAEADVPLFFDREATGPMLTRPRHTLAAPHGRARMVHPWLTAAGLGAALALGAVWTLRAHPGVEVEKEHASRAEEGEDGGTVAVGDTALTSPVPLSPAPSAWSTISVDMPPRPVPGQQRLDANGRCPKLQVPINGGCWFKLRLEPKDCEGEGYYVYKGGCYAPVLAPARPPTSRPVERTGDTPR